MASISINIESTHHAHHCILVPVKVLLPFPGPGSHLTSSCCVQVLSTVPRSLRDVLVLDTFENDRPFCHVSLTWDLSDVSLWLHSGHASLQGCNRSDSVFVLCVLSGGTQLQLVPLLENGAEKTSRLPELLQGSQETQPNACFCHDYLFCIQREGRPHPHLSPGPIPALPLRTCNQDGRNTQE